ncbi:sugar ABC transporter permease [Paenibacillus sp. MER TA 81-3]|uniref:DUF6677 family protein n=1 Tax=Paenibacillus sp. MER TA 81-3 TaxID=2939573 RepID=UPI00203E5B04|nr:DUF6677 family protein [Paenibacillus sp. MER TA 81-3]MCM3338323.1 sugar ABC transporter permease [Paenibacillus sp. MER TA 81-3]
MKKKWLAGVLSFAFPGLGHLYLGKVQKGLIFVFLNIISIVLSSVVIGLFAMLFIWVYAIVDALRLTDSINMNKIQV